VPTLPGYLARDVRGGVAGFYGSRRPGVVVTAAVGWVEQSEAHYPAVGVVMGFGYRLYPSYAGLLLPPNAWHIDVTEIMSGNILGGECSFLRNPLQHGCR
jgi:hypothetical protein